MCPLSNITGGLVWSLCRLVRACEDLRGPCWEWLRWRCRRATEQVEQLFAHLALDFENGGEEDGDALDWFSLEEDREIEVDEVKNSSMDCNALEPVVGFGLEKESYSAITQNALDDEDEFGVDEESDNDESDSDVESDTVEEFEVDGVNNSAMNCNALEPVVGFGMERESYSAIINTLDDEDEFGADEENDSDVESNAVEVEDEYEVDEESDSDTDLNALDTEEKFTLDYALWRVFRTWYTAEDNQRNPEDILELGEERSIESNRLQPAERYRVVDESCMDCIALEPVERNRMVDESCMDCIALEPVERNQMVDESCMDCIALEPVERNRMVDESCMDSIALEPVERNRMATEIENEETTEVENESNEERFDIDSDLMEFQERMARRNVPAADPDIICGGLMDYELGDRVPLISEKKEKKKMRKIRGFFYSLKFWDR